jgi:hypothetical protein
LLLLLLCSRGWKKGKNVFILALFLLFEDILWGIGVLGFAIKSACRSRRSSSVGGERPRRRMCHGCGVR